MDDFIVSALIMLTLLGIIVIVIKVYKQLRLRHYSVPVRDSTKGHRFYMADFFTSTIFCNVEETLLYHGAQCDTCGIYVDDSRMKEADKKIPCKSASSRDAVRRHHWVRGNLPNYSTCMVCGMECEERLSLCDLRCAWCKKTAHDACASKTEECDFGKYQQFIVPPNCLEVRWVGVKGTRQRHLVIQNVRHPEFDNWTPLIVIGNRKSGNNDGETLLRSFRGYLNPAQVIDIQDVSPESALEWCNLLPGIRIYLLVCGGDGTIGWVLSAIERLQLHNLPRMCILPLGTGNDLSRVLGWGEGYTGDVEVTNILNDIKRANPVQLDRWSVDIRHEKHFGLSRPSKNCTMNNYMSIGVDALVTLNFHRQREIWPSLFAHRMINKLCYFTYGTKDVLERECKNLHTKIKVVLDDREIFLPDLEGVVILNISSWGGGCQPWGAPDPQEGLTEPRYDDGTLEVMGLFSSFHIAQLQVGLASPLRLGQARKITIILHGGSAPIQVDGEPWEQHPATITVTHRGQAAMMALTAP